LWRALFSFANALSVLKYSCGERVARAVERVRVGRKSHLGFASLHLSTRINIGKGAVISGRFKKVVYSYIKMILLFLVFLLILPLITISLSISWKTSDNTRKIITILVIQFIFMVVSLSFRRIKFGAIETVVGPLVVVSEVDSQSDYVPALPPGEIRAKVYYGTFGKKRILPIEIYEVNGRNPEKWRSITQRGIWLPPGDNACVIGYRTNNKQILRINGRQVLVTSSPNNSKFEAKITVESGKQYEIYFSNEKAHLVVLELLEKR
jgi:hypothetical protein